MNRGQLIDAVAAATELPRPQVEATITATLAQVRGAVASGEKVQLPGFGTFETAGARRAYRPQPLDRGPVAAGRHPGRGIQGRRHVQTGSRRQPHHQSTKENGSEKSPSEDHLRRRPPAPKATATKATAAKTSGYRSASLARICDVATALGVTMTERAELRDPNAA